MGRLTDWFNPIDWIKYKLRLRKEREKPDWATKEEWQKYLDRQDLAKNRMNQIILVRCKNNKKWNPDSIVQPVTDLEKEFQVCLVQFDGCEWRKVSKDFVGLFYKN